MGLNPVSFITRTRLKTLTMDLLRDTAFGHVVRFVTRGKLKQFQYYEERHPEVWREYVDADKTANVARFGQVEPPEKEIDENKNGDDDIWRRGASIDSARTRVPGDEEYNELSGTRIDPEKGKNIHLVAFLPNDPEVSCSPKDVEKLHLS